jgi:hypothetical protein
MSIPRAQSLSLLVLVLGLDWLLAGKHTRLIFLGFIYVWLYNAFPLLLGLAGIYTLAVWLSEGRLVLRPLFYTAIGLALGLLINPYFPFNVIFAYQHILPKLVEATSVSVGSEWYPYDTGQLLSNSRLALAAFAGGALALGLSGRRMQARTAAAFLLACLFGLMLFQSRRFVEYFPAFALIFAAFAWAPLMHAYIRRSEVTRHVFPIQSQDPGEINHAPARLGPGRIPASRDLAYSPCISGEHRQLQTIYVVPGCVCLAGGQHPGGGARFPNRLG